MKRKFLFFLLPTLLLASCSSDDPNLPSAPGEPIRFKITFADPGNPQTRAATGADFKTTWETNDEIGLYIVKGNGGLQSTNWVNNLNMTYDGSTWSSLPEGKKYYPNDGDELHFYAYYPYDDNGGSPQTLNPMAIAFNVKADQRNNNYNRSDLLLAKAENVVRGSSAVSLQFAHALSLVQVEAKREVNVPHFVDADFTVTLKGAKPGTTLNWSGTPATATGTATDIVMHKVDGMDYTYRALVPAQALPADACVTFVQTTTGKTISMKYQGVQSKQLTANAAHKYSVTLGWGIDPAHEYAVGDVYPHVGPAIGVVFLLTDANGNNLGSQTGNSKHGKIVGLEEGSAREWSETTTATGAIDQLNGLVNMKTIYALSNDFSDYPAFAWVHSLNAATENYSDENAKGVWYLPAFRELSNLSSANINSGLLSAGGISIDFAQNLYWSSSENEDNPDNDSAWQYTGSGTSMDYEKTNLCRVRSALSF